MLISKVFLFIIMFLSFCFADYEEKMVRKSLEVGEGEFSIVYDSIGKTKNEIYSVCLLWVSDYYTSIKNVINQSDRESGIIMIKSYAENMQKLPFGKTSKIYYAFKIQVKDNKIKLSFKTETWGNSPDNTDGPYCYPSKPAVEKMIDYYKNMSKDLFQKIITTEEDF